MASGSAPDLRARLEKFRREFLGLDLTEPVVREGGAPGIRRRVYLDTGATALMPRLLHESLAAYCTKALANSHSSAHRAARVTSREIARARAVIETFVGARAGTDPASQVAVFAGNGATAALNLLADALFPPEVRILLRGGRSRDPELRAIFGDLRDWATSRGVDAADVLHRNLVVVSRIEHHSNILPWMRAVGARNLRFPALTLDGQLDLHDLARILREEGDRVRLVAVAGASNVTGVITPVREVARLTHAAGAELVVDGAQWAPHARVRMHDPDDEAGDIDYLALSGHKLYAPGSRGVLIARRRAFAGPEAVGDVGGGMADVVSTAGFSASPDLAQREEGGTPNLPGSVALGLVVQALMSFGMDLVEEHERGLVAAGTERLRRIPGLALYGPDPARAARVAVFTFNVGELPHGFVAAALSDACNVAVRNGSFCAQLYVRHLLGDGDGDALLDEAPLGGCTALPGLVRASCGVYTGDEDLEALEDGLRFVVSHADELSSSYDLGPGGEWVHRARPSAPAFEIATEVARYFR